MYSHIGAIQLIEQRLPSLTDDLHDEIVEGLLHPQIGEFSRLAQGVIDAGNRDGWSQVISIFMELWLNCDDAVRNALNVSFLEHLNFKDQKVQRQWAFKSMPPVMRKAWVDMDTYNRRLHGG